MAADGLSTAAMILGHRRAMPLLERQRAEALFVLADGSVLMTRGGFGGTP